jgi:hypothetical protein
MAVPVLNLNLAPRPSLWRQRHQVLGWAALCAGGIFLAGAIGFTWRAYHQANRAGRDAVSLTEEARRAARQEQQLQASLQDMDATKEQSRWKLAEKILQERSLPWSRLTAELEQCMVPDMRLKGLQRTRGSAQQVMLKLKGEARTRQAEAEFVEALRSAPIFAQVILERESERAGGGWEFEINLPAVPVPPPFQPRAPRRASASQAKVAAPVQAKAPVSVPAKAPVSAPPSPQAAVPPRPIPPPSLAPPIFRPPVPGGPEATQGRPPQEDVEESNRRRPFRPRPNDPRNPQ